MEPTRHSAQPIRDAAAAALILSELRGADPVSALNDLSAWLREIRAAPGQEDAVQAQVLGLVLEASELHVAGLIAALLERSSKNKGRVPTWHLVSGYLEALCRQLSASATRLLGSAANEPSRQSSAAGAGVRALHACRLLQRACLFRYVDVPSETWRIAYTVHREAEAAGCDSTPVRVHASNRAVTTVTQELLRMLMLQCASPEMMSPALIVAADQVIEQVGAEMTMRPRGVADNPFCFEPAGSAAPFRATDTAERSESLRYFGAGLAYEALKRLHGAGAGGDLKATPGAPSSHVQASAIQHLLVFWRDKAAYTPTARAPTTGEVQVSLGYSQAWQRLSSAKSAVTELSLAEDGDMPLEAPQPWPIRDLSETELGVEVHEASGNGVQPGDVVAVSRTKGEWWLGLILSMHAEAGHSATAVIYVLSRDPTALLMRAVIEKDEEAGVTEEASRQFAHALVRAIIVADGSANSNPNLMLSPEAWKAGRRFQLAASDEGRYLRCARLLRRGVDYARVAFEWVPAEPA